MGVIKQTVNLLALDIDGVLNGRDTHNNLNLIPDNISIEEQVSKGVDLGLKILVDKDKSYIIGHVDLHKLNLLSEVCSQNNVKVIGISSWFSLANTEEKLSKYKDFLGMDIVKVGFSGDAQSRLHQVASFIKENYDLDKFNVNLVYLDDDCRIDATFKYGYESLNLNAFKFLTSDCNTLFLFPWADKGVSEKSLKLANSFWSIGC
nr:MAG TPA: HAD domain protein [Caudoviricetes sp.]